ncbi:MAG: FAD-linked oxidase C-terminal domain-containing protein, partial [Thermodesulfobacteriota bacterium]
VMTSHSLFREVEATLKANQEGEVLFDTFTRVLYSTDASNYQIEPIGVVIPRSIDDVIKTTEIAFRYKIPLLPRGGGTSLAGQAVANALVIDFSKYLNKIVKVDEEASTVRVEPGIYLEQLNNHLKPRNLMFGPDPSTARIATMGGVVGNNATGAHSILYGMAGDNLVGAEVVLSDATAISLGRLDESGLSAKASQQNREGRLYKSLKALREQYRDTIRNDFPKHWRRASGYGLPYLLNNNFNPAQLLASSEGTLAVATEFTLKLVPLPLHRGLVLLQFGDLAEAMETVPLILVQNPSAIELIDRMLISLTKGHRGYASLLSFLEGDPAAVLAIEFYGDTVSEVEKKTSNLINHLRLHKINTSITKALTQEAQANFWAIRRAGLGLLMSKRGDYKPIPCIEDVSVPVENLAGYVLDILEIINRLGTEAGFYGHASAGCLHVRPLVNLKRLDGVSVMKELTDEALRLALRHGGVMSGEHGDGIQRSYLNEKLFGKEIYRAMRELKTAFDPEGRLNPGKVVDALSPVDNLRYDQSYSTHRLKTHLDWSTDGGFSRAVEMCNGQGVCRKLGEGIMCPSYMATKDEMDTTRARANALRAALSGRIPLEQMKSHRMHRVFDLCLECKACKRECPSSVDVAKMKMEFLANYHEAHGKTFRDLFFGYVHELSRHSAPFSVIANPLIKNRFARLILSSLGIHPDRELPGFSRDNFVLWFYNRGSKTTASNKVIYFHDTWVSFYYPEIGKASVKLLEAMGLEVILVPKRVCCGRPMLSKGLIEPARCRAKINAELLSPYVRQGIPVIGTEPSCILTFRDEYPDLLPGNDDANILAQNSYLLDEYLSKIERTKFLNTSWKPLGPSVFFHGHCHQRALLGIESSIELLKLAGCSVTESGAGCCGLAGSFGYEKEHYRTSEAIGEDRLFPAVRESTMDTVIAVTGVSCKQQIGHFTGRQPRHFAEVLADQIDRNNERI